MIDVYFDNIQDVLSSCIATAKYRIFVAVPWFTSMELFKALCRKSENDVKVDLIILDDEINLNKNGLPFYNLIDSGGKIFYTNEYYPLHSKYIIIDDKIVITGSYNYTYLAENKNKENVVVIRDKLIIQRYVDNFNELKYQSVLYSKKIYDIENSQTIYRNEYSSELEIQHQKSVTTSNKLDELPNRIAQSPTSDYLGEPRPLINNSSFVGPTSNSNKLSLNSVTPIKTVNTIGLQTIIDGVKDQMLPMIEVGSTIPCENNHEFVTHEDNQTTMTIRSFYGQDKIASRNTELGFVKINDLPPKVKGAVKVKIIFRVDENKVLRVEVINSSTGNATEVVYMVSSCII